MSKTVTGWQLHRLTALTWEQLAGWIGPVIRGWMAYYGRFRHSVLDPLFARINHHVQEWIRRKYRRLAPYPGHEARLDPDHHPNAGAAAGFPLPAWRDPLKGEEFSDGRVARRVDKDFREGAVRLVRETGKPIAQVARDLGINEGTLGKRMVRTGAAGTAGTGS